MSQTMTESIITHADLAAFGNEHVNLSREDAEEYRSQVNRLRDKLAGFIHEHPDYGLLKMLLNGSLAKGLALKTLNDIDVALYLESEKVPGNERELLEFLAKRLREAYPQMAPEQIQPTTHCIQITFKGTGLKVDVAPVHAIRDDTDDHGYLVNKDTGERVLTSIPRHLRFTRTRKNQQPDHYAQTVRFMKWWVKQRKFESASFRMKSFMSELIVAHVADSGTNLSDYPTALERVFVYMVKSQLKRRISFTDYYPPSKLPGATGKAMEIFDPVNAENNVPGDYNESDRQLIVSAAEDALDAMAEARFATTKGRAVQAWQRVLGNSFRGV